MKDARMVAQPIATGRSAREVTSMTFLPVTEKYHAQRDITDYELPYMPSILKKTLKWIFSWI